MTPKETETSLSCSLLSPIAIGGFTSTTAPSVARSIRDDPSATHEGHDRGPEYPTDPVPGTWPKAENGQ
ncbi:hypothetical protein EMCG_03641 [[Emmonsia] crescens]|uniref:Uncharacterized protein n=1 Tax=[Emmonsia] crescens TaxID=73230 RepID=A0A0G2HUI3_9EURO|nr:hypothetical protein EMCG_03641 [Emmonsia crescens UAMH 3008]